MDNPLENKKYCIVTTVEISLKAFFIPIARELKKNGADVYLVCNMTEDFLNTYGSEFHCINIDIDRGFRFGKTMGSVAALKKLFAKEKFDVVEYFTPNAAFCASIAAKAAGIRVRIHDHWGARYVGLSGAGRVITKKIETVTASLSTHIRQVCTSGMELCISDGVYPKNKVKVLGKGGTVGVDFSLFDVSKKDEYRREIRSRFGVPEDAFLLGFVGRIQQDKGINEFVEAFGKILEKYPDTYLMLVGNIDDQNPIAEANMTWAQQCPNVVFTGPVNDVFRYEAAFDIHVHPSYREGFGMVLQEAAAMSVPIVTTDIIGPRDFACGGEYALLAQVRSSESLAEKILYLMDDTNARESLAKRAYAYTAEYFERSRMVQGIIEDRSGIVRSVLEK